MKTLFKQQGSAHDMMLNYLITNEYSIANEHSLVIVSPMPRRSIFETLALEHFLRLTGMCAVPGTQGNNRGSDLVLKDGNARAIPMSIRRLAAPSRYLIESAILHAAAEQHLDGLSLVILSVPKLVPKMLDRVDALLGGSRVNAAVISDVGGAWIRCPDLGISLDEKGDPRQVMAPDEKEHRLEFPDSTAWMIKVLLLSRLQNHPLWWGGYRGQIRTGAELAELAGVSPSMVSHLFDLLRSRSWLRADRGDEIVITRPRALLEAWLSQAQQRLSRSIPVRPLYGAAPNQAGDILDWLAGRRQQGQGPHAWAVNGWRACHLHGVGFVTDIDQRRISITCLGDHQGLMKSWELMRCDDRDAMFVLQSTRSPRSITGGIVPGLMDGATAVASSLPVVDVIQAALDVASDPARGFEQAEHICKAVVEEIDR